MDYNISLLLDFKCITFLLGMANHILLRMSILSYVFNIYLVLLTFLRFRTFQLLHEKQLGFFSFEI